MVIDVHPEFGYEIACAVPYAYWLHTHGELEKVITCTGMKPFYFFCDNVEEKYTHRSIDNLTNGVQNLPNTWVHHNAMANFGKSYGELTEEEKIKANGWLDYSKWIMPNYKEQFYDASIDLPEKYIVISNRYNLEHGQTPVGYFNIECLYYMFDILTEQGYSVIYKRPKNTEFALDPNEIQNHNIQADVKDIGVITDYDLVNYFDNVYLFDDVIRTNNGTYNELQLKVYSRASGFISMGGGSSILCSCFGQPVVIYANTSGDVRPGYFDENSYFRKLSGAEIFPIIDLRDDIIKRGYHDYSKVYSTIQKVFKIN